MPLTELSPQLPALSAELMRVAAELQKSDAGTKLLRSLKDEASRAEPQRHSTAANLALLYRCQQQLEGGCSPSGSARVQPVAAAVERAEVVVQVQNGLTWREQ